MPDFEAIDKAGVCELAHLLLKCGEFKRKASKMLLVRSIAGYAAVAFACLICGAAAAAGVRSGTLAVTVHVVNSTPTVRLLDAQGKTVTRADVAAAVTTRTENSVVYLVLEY